MIKEEGMSRVLPILFNTEMVRAILAGKKTVTRRVVKQFIWENFVCEGGRVVHYLDIKTDSLKSPAYKAPYKPGDILYVRETWGFEPCSGRCENTCDTEAPDFYMGKEGCFVYKANYGETADDSFPPYMFKWCPSIHMPKEAARIWLKVTDVRVERLQEITIGGCEEEGCWCGHNGDIFAFMALWDSTIKKADSDKYGWKANPWVWVIEFERCEKPKGEKT